MKTQILTIDETRIGEKTILLEDLKTAVESLTASSEDQFQEIKNERWFTRLFDIITLSKKNDIRMSSQIGSLAQAQSLLINILVILSSKDSEISNLVQESFGDIQKLQNNDAYLLRRLKDLEDVVFGFKKAHDVSELTDYDKNTLCACLSYLSNQFTPPSEGQQEYANAVLNFLGCQEVMTENLNEATAHIKTVEARQCLLRCCLEYVYLYHQDDKDWESPICQDIIEKLDVGKKTVSSTRESVIQSIRLRGATGLIDQYEFENQAIDNAFLFNIDLPEETLPKIDKPCSEDSSFCEIITLLSDKYGLDTLSAPTSLPGNLFQKAFKRKEATNESTSKDLQKICGQIYDEKHPCTIAPKTIIGAMKSTPVIFTTAGIHCNLGPNRGPMPQFISYKNIDFSRTSIMRDNSGNPSGVHLYSKDDRIVAYLPMDDPDTFISVLLEASKMQTATQDALLPIDQMSLELKLVYSKIMILFCQEFDLDWVEALRLANDLSISKGDFSLLFDYAQNVHTDVDLQKQIIKLTDVLPYPNEENVATSLIGALIALIQFSTKRCREITIAERTFINQIGKMLGINDDMIQSLIPAAQLPYRLLRKDVKAEEVRGITQALASAGAVSLRVISVAGLGIIAGGLVFNAASGLLKRQKEEKEKRTMEEASQKQLAVLKGSYHSLIKIARDLPISDELSPMILKAAVRTSPGIPEYIRSCDINAFRAAQKTEQKDDTPQSRPCELRIYQVTKTEQKNCFSVTAKVNYAPVHKGDIFALLVNDCPSARIIKVLQIGTGDRQWDEKDPDIISTFILNGIFTADELAGKTFVQIS